jgi:DNA-binding transcriptional MerR regulator
MIPEKRYFAIGEVSDLCHVKPHVLRYWEQEFPQLRPVKRRGNRRYYKYHDVEIVRQIRNLLYEEGFTIGGARKQLREQAKPVDSREPESGVAQQLRAVREEIEAIIQEITV